MLLSWQTDKHCFCSCNFLISTLVNIQLVFLGTVPQEGTPFITVNWEIIVMICTHWERVLRKETYDLIYIKKMWFYSYVMYIIRKIFGYLSLSIIFCNCNSTNINWFEVLEVSVLRLHVISQVWRTNFVMSIFLKFFCIAIMFWRRNIWNICNMCFILHLALSEI